MGRPLSELGKADKLPINDVMPELLQALRAASNAVLIAPPGAGKTTMVAPALLGEAWCKGQVYFFRRAVWPRGWRRSGLPS